jgi:hypothetical protein
MSSRTVFATGRNWRFALGGISLLAIAVSAATPQAPARPQTARTPASTPPPRQSQPSAVRSPTSLTRQTPFGEAVEILRNSTRPPLQIIVLWRQVEAAGVYRDTPIGIDGVAGLRVRQYLDLLTLSLSAGASTKLGYTVDGGVITISTTDALPVSRLVTRVYDISDLVAAPARYALPTMGFGMGYGPQVAPFGTSGGNLGAGLYGPQVSPFGASGGNLGVGSYGLNPAGSFTNSIMGAIPGLSQGRLTFRGR